MQKVVVGRRVGRATYSGFETKLLYVVASSYRSGTSSTRSDRNSGGENRTRRDEVGARLAAAQLADDSVPCEGRSTTRAPRRRSCDRSSARTRRAHREHAEPDREHAETPDDPVELLACDVGVLVDRERVDVLLQLVVRDERRGEAIAAASTRRTTTTRPPSRGHSAPLDGGAGYRSTPRVQGVHALVSNATASADDVLGTMSTVVILAIGVAITVALPLVSRRGRFDPFEPIAIFALAWGVMFVVRPIAIVIRDDTIFYGVDIGATLDEAVLRPAWRLRRRVPPSPRGSYRPATSASPDQVDTRSTPAGPSGAAATGVVALLLFLLPSGGVSAIGTFLGGRGAELDELLATSPMYLWWASLLVIPAALVAVAVAVAERRPSTVLVAAVLLGIALVRTIPVGNRVYLLVLGGGIVVFLYLRVRSRPGLVVLVVAPLLALFVSKAARPALRRTARTWRRSSGSSRRRHAFRLILEGPDAEMAPALAGALSVVPDQLPHRTEAQRSAILRRPIPRQLWAAKPPPPGQEVVESCGRKPVRPVGSTRRSRRPLLLGLRSARCPGRPRCLRRASAHGVRLPPPVRGRSRRADRLRRRPLVPRRRREAGPRSASSSRGRCAPPDRSHLSARGAAEALGSRRRRRPDDATTSLGSPYRNGAAASICWTVRGRMCQCVYIWDDAGSVHSASFRGWAAARLASASLVAATLFGLTSSSVGRAATLPSGFHETIVFSGLTQPATVRFASDGRVSSQRRAVS